MTAVSNGRGRISQLAGTVSNRVLEGLDPDLVVERLDVNAVLDRVDLNAVLGRVDVDALLLRIDVNVLLERADVNQLLKRVDVDAILAGIDVDAVMDRVDLERMLEGVDLQRLVRRAGLPELIADSTGQVAGSALDLARRQLVGLDVGVGRLAQRFLGRDPDVLPVGPPVGPSALLADGRERIEAPETTRSRARARMEVSGFYAGAVSRVLAFGGDVALATSIFTVGAVTLLWLLGTLLGVVLGTGPRTGPWWALAFGTWLVLYRSVSTALAGRTPVMLLAGLRVVSRDGRPLCPRQALVQTVCLPLSLLAFGTGAAWMVVDRAAGVAQPRRRFDRRLRLGWPAGRDALARCALDRRAQQRPRRARWGGVSSPGACEHSRADARHARAPIVGRREEAGWKTESSARWR